MRRIGLRVISANTSERTDESSSVKMVTVEEERRCGGTDSALR